MKRQTYIFLTNIGLKVFITGLLCWLAYGATKVTFTIADYVKQNGHGEKVFIVFIITCGVLAILALLGMLYSAIKGIYDWIRSEWQLAADIVRDEEYMNKCKITPNKVVKQSRRKK